MELQHAMVAIIPCDDLDQSQAFYERLGFALESDYPAHGYRILRDDAGANLHLTRTEPGWIVPERNAYGVYFYADNVKALAADFGCEPQLKPWGLVEFAVTDPSGTLVRVGWPI